MGNIVTSSKEKSTTSKKMMKCQIHDLRFSEVNNLPHITQISLPREECRSQGSWGLSHLSPKHGGMSLVESKRLLGITHTDSVCFYYLFICRKRFTLSYHLLPISLFFLLLFPPRSPSTWLYVLVVSSSMWAAATHGNWQWAVWFQDRKQTWPTEEASTDL